jgi:hypothetical protein
MYRSRYINTYRPRYIDINRSRYIDINRSRYIDINGSRYDIYIRRDITIARHRSLSCARWIQFTPPAILPKIHSYPTLHSTSWSSEWSLSFGLPHQNPVHLGLPSVFFLSGLVTTILKCVSKLPSCYRLLDLMLLILFSENQATNYEAPHYIMGSPREAAISVTVGRECDDARAHCAIAKHYSCFTYRPTSSRPRVVSLM